MSESTKSATDVSVLKSARERCYQAKDKFYKCIEDSGKDWNIGDPIPSECKEARKTFEEFCRRTWVQHFDATYDKDLRLLQILKTNINKSDSTAIGRLAGSDQRDS